MGIVKENIDLTEHISFIDNKKIIQASNIDLEGILKKLIDEGIPIDKTKSERKINYSIFSHPNTLADRTSFLPLDMALSSSVRLTIIGYILRDTNGTLKIELDDFRDKSERDFDPFRPIGPRDCRVGLYGFAEYNSLDLNDGVNTISRIVKVFRKYHDEIRYGDLSKLDIKNGIFPLEVN